MINAKGETDILRDLNLPNQIEPGKYWFVANIEYKNLSSSSKDVFEVVEEKTTTPIQLTKISYLWIFLVAIILLLIIIIILLIRRRRRREGETGHKKHLKKMVNYIKEEVREHKVGGQGGYE